MLATTTFVVTTHPASSHAALRIFPGSGHPPASDPPSWLTPSASESVAPRRRRAMGCASTAVRRSTYARWVSVTPPLPAARRGLSGSAEEERRARVLTMTGRRPHRQHAVGGPRRWTMPPLMVASAQNRRRGRLHPTVAAPADGPRRWTMPPLIVASAQNRRRGRLHPTVAPADGHEDYCRVLRDGHSSYDALVRRVVPVLAPERLPSALEHPSLGVVPSLATPGGGGVSDAGEMKRDEPSGRILLTLIDAEWGDAYALQVAALVDGYGRAPGGAAGIAGGWPLTLVPGLHAIGAHVPPAMLAQLEGLRAELNPLAAAEDPYALLDAARAMTSPGTASAVLLDTLSTGGSFLSYHRLARCENRRVKSSTLRVAVARTIGAAENGAPPADGSSGTSGGGVHFVIVETTRGYVLGVVTFAPRHLGRYQRAVHKPHPYCAGLPVALAGVAVAAACAGLREPGCDHKPEKRVLDPCCGSGTILHEAWARGHAATGLEIQAVWARYASENVAAMSAAADACRSLRAVAGSAEEEERLAARSPPVPVVHNADAVEWARAWVEMEHEGEVDPFDCVVGNLPYGHAVCIGGGSKYAAPEDQARVKAGALEDLRPMLLALAPMAPRHAYFFGAPGGGRLMEETGAFAGVREVCVCRSGKRYLVVADSRTMSAGDDARETIELGGVNLPKAS